MSRSWAIDEASQYFPPVPLSLVRHALALQSPADGKIIHSRRWGLICLIKACFSSHALLPPLPTSPNSAFKNNPEISEQQSPADPWRGWAVAMRADCDPGPSAREVPHHSVTTQRFYCWQQSYHLRQLTGFQSAGTHKDKPQMSRRHALPGRPPEASALFWHLGVDCSLPPV